MEKNARAKHQKHVPQLQRFKFFSQTLFFRRKTNKHFGSKFVQNNHGMVEKSLKKFQKTKMVSSFLKSKIPEEICDVAI